MFKVVPGNCEFEIRLDGEIRKRDGSECTPPVSNGKVSIELYGKLHTVAVSWLALIAHFEVDLPSILENRLMDINFVESSPYIKTVSGMIMVFRKPIEFMGYRLIPGHTRYGVNQYGDVFDFHIGWKIAQARHDESGKNYCEVHIYDPEIKRSARKKVHRLVALAWVPNSDHVNKYLVNHIDGVKYNNYYKNLEWTDYQGNMIHAVANSLRSDNEPCMLRDVFTGVVTDYPSTGAAVDFLGMHKSTRKDRLAFRNPAKLLKGRYEYRLKTDTTPWFYTESPKQQRAGRYNLNITLADGSQVTYTDTRTFKKDYGVWNVNSIEDIVSKAEQMYPGMKIVVEDTFITKPVQAYKVSTGEVFEAQGIRQLAKVIGVTYASIYTALKKGPTRVAQGYAYRYKSDDEWDKNFTYNESPSVCILVTHHDTNETTVYKSLRAVEKQLGIDRSVIKNRLKTGESYRGMSFKHSK